VREKGSVATGWIREFGRGAIAIGFLFHAAEPARAQWDLSSNVSLRETLAQNTAFSSSSSNSSNPGKSDLITSVRLTGRALRIGPRFHLDAIYSPDAQFYRDQPHFNRVSQMSRALGSYDISERNVLTFSETYYYTPNQGVTDESFGSPTSFTRFTDRRQLNALVGIRHSLTERTGLILDVRNYYQLFSDPLLVDAVGYGGDARVNHKLSPETSFDVGVGNTWNRFRNQDPMISSVTRRRESQIASLFSGLNRKIGSSLIATARVGYNIVTPGDSALPHRHVLLVQGSLSWSGPKLNAAGGYSQDINTGSGPLDLSQTKTIYSSTAYKFTEILTGALLVNRTVSERPSSTVRVSILAANATASLRFKMGNRLEGSAGFSRYLQSSPRLNAPDLAHNAFSVGLSAAFD